MFPTPVRVHLVNPIFDLTGNTKRSSWPIKDVLARLSKEDSGIAVILCNQVEPDTVLAQLEELNELSENSNETNNSSRDFRTIGLGSQILSDLGVQKMIVMSSPKRYHAISGFGLEIVDYMTN